MPVSAKWGPWHLNECLVVLNRELEERFPGIDIGTIADDHHKPPSDHIPNKYDRVNADDFMITKNFTATECQWLIETVLTKDSRVKYIIRNREIWKPDTGWQDYHGSDPHTGHCHVSVVDSAHSVTRPWLNQKGRTVVFTNVQGYLPTLLLGDEDPIAPGAPHLVTRMQIMLDYLVPETVKADGKYGPKTAASLGHIFGEKAKASVTLPMWNQLYGILSAPPSER